VDALPGLATQSQCVTPGIPFWTQAQLSAQDPAKRFRREYLVIVSAEKDSICQFGDLENVNVGPFLVTSHQQRLENDGCRTLGAFHLRFFVTAPECFEDTRLGLRTAFNRRTESSYQHANIPVKPRSVES
jgi:hypothetical protein